MHPLAGALLRRKEVLFGRVAHEEWPASARSLRAARPLLQHAVGWSTAARKTSPFAGPEPTDSGQPLDKYEELKQRQAAMAEMLREQTMREVNQAAQGRRPEGVHHVLGKEHVGPSLDDAVKKLVDNQGVGANYDDDREEWGGPKGQEPTRYGDWEVKGRISDF